MSDGAPAHKPAPTARPYPSLGQRPRYQPAAAPPVAPRRLETGAWTAQLALGGISLARYMGRRPMLAWQRAFGPQPRQIYRRPDQRRLHRLGFERQRRGTCQLRATPWVGVPIASSPERAAQPLSRSFRSGSRRFACVQAAAGGGSGVAGSSQGLTTRKPARRKSATLRVAITRP